MKDTWKESGKCRKEYYIKENSCKKPVWLLAGIFVFYGIFCSFLK
jgi:hypothetical protein